MSILRGKLQDDTIARIFDQEQWRSYAKLEELYAAGITGSALEEAQQAVQQQIENYFQTNKPNLGDHALKMQVKQYWGYVQDDIAQDMGVELPKRP